MKCFVFLFFWWIPFGSSSQCIDSVLVGYGGGVTGGKTVYKVSNQMIYKGSGLTLVSYSEHVKLKRRDCRRIYFKSKEVYNSVLGFFKPFNTYKFLEIYIQDKSIRYTWGDPYFTTPKKIEDLYDRIIKHSSIINFKQ